MNLQRKAAPRVGPEARPENENQPPESTRFAPPAQVRPVRLWRFLVWPKKFGVRCADTNERVLSALERILAGGDYARLIAADGRTIAVVEGDFFEALRRAAFDYDPPLSMCCGILS